jgi:adenylylsulfate kinase
MLYFANELSQRNTMISQSDKEKMIQQRAVVIWITGLSGSGKTTLANNIEKALFNKGYLTRIRQLAKDIIGKERFIEIYVSTPLEICAQRDVKGFYANARAGRIENFTGISSPYEIPLNPDVEINTALIPVEVSLEKCLAVILPRIVMGSDQKI